MVYPEELSFSQPRCLLSLWWFQWSPWLRVQLAQEHNVLPLKRGSSAEQTPCGAAVREAGRKLLPHLLPYASFGEIPLHRFLQWLPNVSFHRLCGALSVANVLQGGKQQENWGKNFPLFSFSLFFYTQSHRLNWFHTSPRSELRTRVSKREFKSHLFLLDSSLALGQASHLQGAIFRLCTSSCLEAVDMIWQTFLRSLNRKLCRCFAKKEETNQTAQ